MPNLTVAEQRRAAEYFTKEITRLADRPLRLMEVCGTHTVAIFRAGIRQLLPPQVELVSGPGCPICVTPTEYIDLAVEYSRQPDVIITTFGDMLRVPGTSSSLMAEKAAGADIRVLYSPLDSLSIARHNLHKQIILLAVGFETTAPTVAATVLGAEQSGLTNFRILSAHKLVPPALNALLNAPDSRIDGLLLPGHVSAVIGTEPYQFIAGRYAVPAVVAGFEPLDILQSVYMLVRQLSAGEARLDNQYARVVRPEGNPAARSVLEQVFAVTDSGWRGLGNISSSGLKLNDCYQRFDAQVMLPLKRPQSREPAGCCCGEVLRGVKHPTACPLFGRSCQPDNPVGACMVSVEGACAAWYKYGAGRWQA